MKVKLVKVLIIGGLISGLAFAGYHAPEPGDPAKEAMYQKFKQPPINPFSRSRIRTGSSRLPGKLEKGYLINESFEGTEFPPTGWTTEVVSGYYDWNRNLGTSHPSGYPAHSGNYLAVYKSYYASTGSNARLITPEISLTFGANPELSFWMFHDNGYMYSHDSLVVEIKVYNGGWPSDWTRLEKYERYNSAGDMWVEHTIDLSPYYGQTIMIAFHAFSGYGNDIHIDDVSINVDVPNDAGVSAILSPAGTYLLGSSVEPVVEVTNFGTAANTFDVTVEIGSYSATQTVSLDAGAVDTVHFPLATLNQSGVVNVVAYTSLAGDMVPGNDTLTTTIYVLNDLVDFEGTNGNFTADPSSGAWEWGVPTAGPDSAHSGTNCWGTVLDGNYENSAVWFLYTPSMRVVGDDPSISFYHWYEIETYFDGGNVQISTDGGNTWTLIEPVGGYPYSYVSALGDAGFSGYLSDWSQVTFDLSGIVSNGDIFQLRFVFASDGSVNRNGWYIDDFGLCNIEFFTPSYDVAASALPGLNDFYSLNDTITPMVEVQNLGNTAADFTVTYTILKSGQNVYSNSMPVSLNPGSVDTVEFPPFVLNSSGIYTVTAIVDYPLDVVPENDTVNGGFFAPDEVETFDYCLFPPLGWSVYSIGDTVNSYGERPTWRLWTDTTSYGHGDPYSGCSIWHNDDNVQDSCNDWIVKGPIYVADPNAAIAFYQSGYYVSMIMYHGIWISTEGPDPRVNNFTELVDLSSYVPGNMSWSLVGPLTELGAYAGDTVYIAFVYHGDYDDEWYIDNVMLIGAYTMPNDVIVGGFPIAGGDTLSAGATTLYTYVMNPSTSPGPLSFRLNARVTHNGMVVYNQYTTVANLNPGELRQVFFSPDFVPFESGEYIYTLDAMVSNDPTTVNNVVTDTFYVDLYGGQAGETRVPRVFALRNITPNPASGPVTIAFDVARSSNVELKVFDISGRAVASLVNGVMNPGRYVLRWDGTTVNGKKVAGGIYFIEYRAGDFKALKKLVILGD